MTDKKEIFENITYRIGENRISVIISTNHKNEEILTLEIEDGKRNEYSHIDFKREDWYYLQHIFSTLGRHLFPFVIKKHIKEELVKK